VEKGFDRFTICARETSKTFINALLYLSNIPATERWKFK